MNERDFIYWLNGFLELSDAKELNEKQVIILREHIALVMTKVTGDNNPDWGNLLHKSWGGPTTITC